MIVKKLIALCKEAKTVVLINGGDDGQWVSDGAAIYPMWEMPAFQTAQGLCRVYDISEKVQDKMILRTLKQMPKEYEFKDYADNEQRVEALKMTISDGKRVLIPVITSHGLQFVCEKSLEPFMDEIDGRMEIYERITSNGKIYFAVKSGMYLIGIVMPYDAVTDEMCKTLKTAANYCQLALYNKQVERKEANK